MITDADTGADGPRIVYVNAAFTRITGYTAEQVLGRSPRLLQSPDADLSALTRIRSAMAHRQPIQLEILNRRADGSPYRAHLSICALADQQGVITHWLSVQREIDDGLPAAVPARTATDRQLHSAFHDAPLGIAVTTPSGVLLQANPALCRMLGRAPATLVGSDLFGLTHPDDIAAARAACRGLADGSATVAELECRLRHADGSYRFTLVTTSRVDDPTGRAGHLVMQLQDTDERVTHAASLAHQALHDPLTGLANRTLFLDRLEQALAQARRDGSRVGLLFCDVDSFKEINDALGHGAGDHVLTTLARRFRAVLRPSDTAARVGGDEFMIICSDTDLRQAEQIADRLIAAASKPILHRGDLITTSVSVGVITSADADAGSLIREADRAMYLAKSDGRARRMSAYPPPGDAEPATAEGAGY